MSTPADNAAESYRESRTAVSCEAAASRSSSAVRRVRIYSGEVDVALESSIAGAFQQSKQRRPLSRPGPTPDDDDDTVMRLALGQSNEVVPVTGTRMHPWSCAVWRTTRVGGVLRQEIAHSHDIVTEFAEQVAEILGDVLVEQEPHRSSRAICCATSRSISPRWSS
jgi:hypothetical protein